MRIFRSLYRQVPLLAVGIIVAFLLWCWLYAKTMAIIIPTHHIDGAFQTASGLMRLAAGELPGRDFLPYLGIGPLFFLYPLYWLDGFDMSSTVFTAHATVLTLYALVFAILAKLCSPDTPAVHAVATGAATVMMIFLIQRVIGSTMLEFPLSPGNSLRPIRAALPYLVAGALWWILQKQRLSCLATTHSQAMAVGFVCGLALLWSNDTAYVSAGLGGIAGACLLLPRVAYGLQSWLVHIGLALLAMLVTAALAYSIATGGHPWAIFAYNFQDVAPDQWWYFSVWDKTLHTRVYNLVDIPFNIWNQKELAVGFFPLLVLIATSITRRKPTHILTLYVGTSLLCSGTLSSTGGNIQYAYLVPFVLWGFMVLLYTTMGYIASYAHNLVRNVCCSITLCIASILAFSQHHTHTSKNAALAQDPSFVYHVDLGGYLDTHHAKMLLTIADQPNATIVEEYWGLWSAEQRAQTSSLWKVDATIHALGTVRQQSVQAMERATHAITTYPGGIGKDAHWQTWAMIQNFWFYNRILEGFVPQHTGVNTILWRRVRPSDGILVQPQACSVASDAQSITLPNAPKGLYAVEITYHVQGKGRFHLLMTTKSPTRWDASLDPKASWSSFPVWIDGTTPPTFPGYILGSTERSFSLSSCRAKRLTNPGIKLVAPTLH